MVSAMLSAVPSQLSIAPVSLLKSESDALIMASQPAIEFLPKMADAAAACSDSERPPILSRREIMVSLRLMEPSSFSTRAILYLSMKDCICLVGLARFVRPVRRAVPD